MKSVEEIRKLLGKNVKVTLDVGVVAEGQLLAFDEGGGAVLLDDMGAKHFCWPMLEVTEK